MPLKTFADTDLWRVAHQLTLTIYRMTNEFPKHETYGLMSIANGSLEELRYFLILARDLEYCPPTAIDATKAEADRVGAMMGALEKSLKKKLAQ